MKITIGLIDDHDAAMDVMELLLQHKDVTIVMRASNGQDLGYRLEDHKGFLPDIMLIDTDMPLMNGIETTVWMRLHHPSVKLIATSLNPNDPAIPKMLKAGCCAYFNLQLERNVYLKALRQVYTKGYYNPEANDLKGFWETFRKVDKEKSPLTADKQRFLDLACGDLSYDQILQEMKLTQRQANGYIDALFRKFHVRGRNGLVFEALRTGFVAA